MTDVRITMLVDNGVLEPEDGRDGAARLTSEHGFSLWIETRDHHVLLDTGQGPAIETNVPALGIDLAKTDALILSHGHYDHSGGVLYALKSAGHASVHCHPATFTTRYSVFDGEAKSIGMPDLPQQALRSLPMGTVHWTLGPAWLSEDIGLTGPVPRMNDFEDTGGPFFLDETGWRPDPLEDDMALWMRTREGLVICLGCAHAGMVNTLDWIGRLHPGERVHAVIGGLHLMKASEDRIGRTAEALLALDPSVVVPCHCTGDRAVNALLDALGPRVVHGASGLVLEL
jgi:7,8-dihydropterin-6-yl-methyl-4-(beta-D-ribofuranosyl)aminobenzene 5'-phosphate synthase